MSLALSIAEMERARTARDPSYDGLFVLGVRTTGIFCRPTCPARTAAAKNVVFFADTAAALAAGFRPCKRCRPTAPSDEPAWATELLAELSQGGGRISEQALAARGLDPATVRRHFQRNYGMTFQAFARARRLNAARTELQTGGAVEDAREAGGYESDSGFREAFARLFGAAPRSARGDVIELAWFSSPLGPLVAGASAKGVCFLEFSDPARLGKQLTSLRTAFAATVAPGMTAALEQLRDELTAYFAGALRRFTAPLDVRGTSFQVRVWSELLKIPYGETRSYEQLAAAVGSPTAVRAVGTANGRNRMSIVIPCHRVVNKGGALGGYGGGLRRKEFLLALERNSLECGGLSPL